MAIHSDKTISNTVLIAGIGLGICGDVLIGDVITTGPGLALWMALFGLSAFWLAANRQSPHLYTIGIWSVVAFAAALVLVFRTLPVVILGMCGVLLTAAAMVLMELKGISLKRSSIADHLTAGIHVPLQAVTGVFPILGTLEIRDGVRNPRHLAILKGLLIALPLVLLFGSLFSQADLKFSSLATSVLSVFSPRLPEHVVITLVYFWLGTGLLAVIYREPAPQKTVITRFSLGAEETLIIMGALAVLFLTFVFLQLPYLFGGRETIESTAGLSLAEYARRGFFELVAVSGLTLGVLLVMAGVSRAPRLFRPLAGILLACVLLILASALQRLFLYTQAFGLTVDRITAFTFMVWIFLCLILYGLIILRGQTEGFAMGMTCSAVVIAFLFALANPADVVIRVNTGMASSSDRQVDFLYLKNLESDGIPVLIDNIASLPAVEQCLLTTNWLQALDDLGPIRHTVRGQDDWRTWNLIKNRARTTIELHRSELIGIRDRTCRFAATLGAGNAFGN